MLSAARQCGMVRVQEDSGGEEDEEDEAVEAEKGSVCVVFREEQRQTRCICEECWDLIMGGVKRMRVFLYVPISFLLDCVLQQSYDPRCGRAIPHTWQPFLYTVHRFHESQKTDLRPGVHQVSEITSREPAAFWDLASSLHAPSRCSFPYVTHTNATRPRSQFPVLLCLQRSTVVGQPFSLWWCSTDHTSITRDRSEWLT